MRTLDIVLLVILLLAFLGSISYIIYLHAHHRSIDEDDCHIGKKDDLKAYIETEKKRERKASLKKKRELEKLDQQESKKNRKLQKKKGRSI